jgi:hypothetical protein
LFENILRLFIALCFLFFLPGNALGFLAAGSRILTEQDLLWPLGGGFLLGAVLRFLLIRRIPGAETFEHELTHAVVALFFLGRITEFTVTKRRGGFVRYERVMGGVFAGDMITLAPYFLPTFSLIMALVYPFLPGNWGMPFVAVAGATLAYHTFSTIEETRRNWTAVPFPSAGSGELTQSDISQVGFLYAAIVITSATLALHALVFCLLTAGYAGVPAWILGNNTDSLEFWQKIVNWILPLIQNLLG